MSKKRNHISRRQRKAQQEAAEQAAQEQAQKESLERYASKMGITTSEESRERAARAAGIGTTGTGATGAGTATGNGGSADLYSAADSVANVTADDDASTLNRALRHTEHEVQKTAGELQHGAADIVDNLDGHQRENGPLAFNEEADEQTLEKKAQDPASDYTDWDNEAYWQAQEQADQAAKSSTQDSNNTAEDTEDAADTTYSTGVHDTLGSSIPPRNSAGETIGLFGTHKQSFSEVYHLTRRGKAKRLKQIAKIAMHYDVVKGLTPVRMRLMLEALGPTFVKVGQILSMRSEILPQPFCDELALLRANADPMPYAVVLQTLEHEYGRPVDEIFAHIDTTPLGSASLAQVHRATLKTGEDVAIKVQRPGVRETMAEDVSIMRSIAKGATKVMHSAQIVDLQGVIEELWETFDEETDFLNEARNLCEFKRFCQSYNYMDCPTPYVDLCTEHVLVMEYIDGIPMAKTAKLTADGYSLKEIGTKLVDNYSSQILDAGFFHADPHPGNIMIRGGQIVLIDLGMTGRLDVPTRVALKQMLAAVAQQDSPQLANALLRFAGTDASSSDYPELLADLDGIIQEFGNMDLADLNLADFLTSLTSMARRHGIEVPSSITTVGRALVTLEGTLDEFIPDVNMIEIITRHIVGSTSWGARATDELKKLAIESHQALHSSLRTMHETEVALHMLTRGELRLNAELVGSQEPLQQLSDMVNRLTMALIVVGLFVGSSIVYFAGMKPIIFGIPVVGFMGYVVAFVLSVWIVFDTMRKSRANRKRRK